MTYHVKREHLIGDKPVPFELPCSDPVPMADGRVFVFSVTPSGMAKSHVVRADQVYFKLESV